MGMYTHCRGWIELGDLEMTEKKFEEIINKAEKISQRASQCIICTKFHRGFNFCNYIFIGGEIKNYDEDWDKYLEFLFDNFNISEYSIQTKHEEDNTWRDFLQ